MSFETEVYSLRPRLFAYATKLTKNKDDAEDLVQDAFLTALSKRHLFQEGTNLSAWVFTILRNDFLSKMRKAGRIVADVDDILASKMPSPAAQFDTVALKELYVEIDKLPKAQKESLLLIAAEGFSYEEVAKIVGVAEGTIKSRVSRARDTLEQVLHYDYSIQHNR